MAKRNKPTDEYFSNIIYNVCMITLWAFRTGNDLFAYCKIFSVDHLRGRIKISSLFAHSSCFWFGRRFMFNLLFFIKTILFPRLWLFLRFLLAFFSGSCFSFLPTFLRSSSNSARRTSSPFLLLKRKWIIISQV